ncbi:MAG: agmatine deiminase family protein [Bacteroidales bacterium]
MVNDAPIPRDLGWRPLPAWSVPARFWLGWPAAGNDAQHDEAVREDCLGLAELLSDFAPVSLICSCRDVAEVALRTPPNVAAFAAEYDAAQAGCHQPLWLGDAAGNPVAAVVFSALGRELAERAGVVVLEPPPGLPCGVEADGEGSALLAVTPDRHEMAAEVACRWLGVDCPILLEPLDAGPSSPPARFLAPGLVVLPPHPANYRRLDAVVDAGGRRMTLLELPNAKRGDGCYADCLVAGNAVVVPDFEDGRGTEAFNRVAAALPGRRVSAFPAGWLAAGGGGLGCVVAVQPQRR